MKSVTEIEATMFKVPNGTSDQFLKGDGTVDATPYLHDIGMNDTHITCTQHNTKNNKIDRRLLLVSVWVPGNETTRTVTYPYGASIGDKWTYQHGMVVIFSFASKVNGQLSININSTGAKRVYLHGTTNFSDRYYIPSGASAMFVYDEPSSSFKMIDVIKNPYLDTSFIGTCSTASSTAAKVVTIAEFTSSYLVKGVKVVINFSNSNTASVSSVTLNVSGTGAKPIKIRKNNTITNLPAAGYLNVAYPVEFMYDGTNWIATNIEIDSTYNLSNYVTTSMLNNYTINDSFTEATNLIPIGVQSATSEFTHQVQLDLEYTERLSNSREDIGYMQNLFASANKSSHLICYSSQITTGASAQSFINKLKAVAQKLEYSIYTENDLEQMITALSNANPIIFKLEFNNTATPRPILIVECYKQLT